MPLRDTLNDENRYPLVFGILMGSAARLLGHRSSICGAFEPAYQSDPDGLLRTLNCCHGLGQEHAEQFGRLHAVPRLLPVSLKHGLSRLRYSSGRG